MKEHLSRLAAGALIVLGLCQSAAAQKLIGQTRSFPIIITKPGSYKLRTNLVVPDANTTAILVHADNVTIDLSGFSIIGPCTGAHRAARRAPVSALTPPAYRTRRCSTEQCKAREATASRCPFLLRPFPASKA